MAFNFQDFRQNMLGFAAGGALSDAGWHAYEEALEQWISEQDPNAFLRVTALVNEGIPKFLAATPPGAISAAFTFIGSWITRSKSLSKPQNVLLKKALQYTMKSAGRGLERSLKNADASGEQIEADTVQTPLAKKWEQWWSDSGPLLEAESLMSDIPEEKVNHFAAMYWAVMLECMGDQPAEIHTSLAGIAFRAKYALDTLARNHQEWLIRHLEDDQDFDAIVADPFPYVRKILTLSVAVVPARREDEIKDWIDKTVPVPEVKALIRGLGKDAGEKLSSVYAKLERAATKVYPFAAHTAKVTIAFFIIGVYLQILGTGITLSALMHPEVIIPGSILGSLVFWVVFMLVINWKHRGWGIAIALGACALSLSLASGLTVVNPAPIAWLGYFVMFFGLVGVWVARCLMPIGDKFLAAIGAVTDGVRGFDETSLIGQFAIAVINAVPRVEMMLPKKNEEGERPEPNFFINLGTTITIIFTLFGLLLTVIQTAYFGSHPVTWMLGVAMLIGLIADCGKRFSDLIKKTWREKMTLGTMKYLAIAAIGLILIGVAKGSLMMILGADTVQKMEAHSKDAASSWIDAKPASGTQAPPTPKKDHILPECRSFPDLPTCQ